MDTAKVFMNGRSQAVRLPKEYRFDDEEVYINRVGNIVMLYPKEEKWTNFLASLEMFSDDFMDGAREQGTFEKRENI